MAKILVGPGQESQWIIYMGVIAKIIIPIEFSARNVCLLAIL